MNEIIVCQGLLKHSRLMQQSEYILSNSIAFYYKYKGENDPITEFRINLLIVGAASTSNSITFTFAPIPPQILQTVKAAIIYYGTSDEKLLIINIKDNFVKSQLANGSLTIYYA